MKRLLVCIYTHNTWGGIENWLCGLVDYLGAQGWDVVLGLARGRKYNDPKEFRRAYPQFDCIELDGRAGTPNSRMLAVTRAIRRVRPDIVMPLGLADVYASVALLKETAFPVRLAIAIHATNLELLEDLRRYEPVVDLCLGVNPLQRRFLETWSSYLPARLGTIMNGVRLPDSISPPVLRGSGPLRIAFVGRLNQLHKRVLEAVPLVRELDRRKVEYQLSFIGDGDAEESLRAQLAPSISSGRVAVHGYVSPEHIHQKIYPQQDVLIMFSPSEGCPLAVQEAMAHGVVPVCAEFIGIHSLGFIRHQINAFIYPCGETLQAADYLEILASDRHRLLQMAIACRETSHGFSLNDTLERWRDALDRLARSPPRLLVRSDAGLGVAHGREGSRLERLGLSPIWADRVRRHLRRWPRLVDGWDEWPGTYSWLDERARSTMINRLASLDRVAATGSGLHGDLHD